MNAWVVLLWVFAGFMLCLMVGWRFRTRGSPPKHVIPPLSVASSGQRIMSCPSCSQRMMFTLPLKGNRAQCRKCSARFKLDIDDQGNVYITELQPPEHDSLVQSLSECYEILDIQPDALPIDIRLAYKRKIMEYHPDKVGGLGVKIKQVAETETRRINAAYAMLEEQGKI